VVDEIEEDLAEFIRVLRDRDIEVHRPASWDSTRLIQTPFWRSSQLYSLMPRDTLLVFGNLVVESPSPLRARYLESVPFRPVLERLVQKNGLHIAAPKPILRDETFVGEQLAELEVLFDAANCIRVGRDVFMDVNRSANHRGVAWLERALQRFVSSDVRVHPVSLGTDHIDVTLIPLRPGVLMIDPSKVDDDNLPAPFRSWDRVKVDEVMPVRDYGLPYPLASNDGIGRNVLMLDPDTVVVDEIQAPLIRALERRKFTVIPLRYRHGRTLGGSWHCITLDTHRDGELVSYFE
jgi:glycine amidinotransferase/scyllo-inosamine-4-phosphate amidinotransferase 1